MQGTICGRRDLPLAALAHTTGTSAIDGAVPISGDLAEGLAQSARSGRKPFEGRMVKPVAQSYDCPRSTSACRSSWGK
jgi:hypothetical protein